MHRKGQSSLEQLLVTALGLAFIALIFYFAISFATDNIRAAQGKDAVEKLANAADYVYSLGPGSKDTVNLFLPEGVEFLNTSGNRIHLRISLSSGSTDIFANTKTAIIGSLPGTSGPMTVDVISTSSGKVMIGGDLITCNPTTIMKSFVQGGSGTDSVSITNVVDYTINDLGASVSGNILDLVSISTPPSSSLSAGASTSTGLSFSVSTSKTVGTYSGQLIVNGTNSSECSTSITVIVTRVGGPDTQGPAVTSLSYSPISPTSSTPITVNATGSDASTGNSTIAMCQVQIDNSGIWNDMTANDGAYNQITENAYYNLGTLSNGTHTISVRCIDESLNIGTASTTIINVGAGGDVTGPIVTFIGIYPDAPTTLSSIVLNATGSDSTTGNSNISMCQISLDLGTWTNMTAVGTAYGTSITQNVNYSIGNLTAGQHTAEVRCIDSANNTGTANTYYINVTGADTTGPIVSFIGIYPAAPTTLSSIVLNATGTDNATGNSNISMCRFKLDGAINWTNMTAVGTYNTSVTQNVTYALGNLTAGQHNATVMCIDSMNNNGTTSEYLFNVSGVDTTGPIITFITHSPNPAYTTSSVRINATGSDSTTGGSNISLCQIQLDGSVTWTTMTAVGTYNTSVTQNVTYLWGTLSAGQHNVSVRCIDSMNNNGTPSNYSFNVTAPDTIGPIVTALSNYPVSPSKSDTVIINATGSDATTGGSWISLCRISLDSGAWNDMTAVGTYNTSITQAVTYSLGTLTKGSHTVSVYCIDSAGNTGNTSNLTFTVTGVGKPILFLTVGASPDANEQYWIDWLSATSSEVGLNWSYDVYPYSSATGGTINPANYNITVMANYPTGVAALNTLINNNRAANHYFVCLGIGVTNCISELGVSGTSGVSQSRKNLQVLASHYITTGYTIGTNYDIYTLNNIMYSHNSWTGTAILSQTNGANKITIGQASNFLHNGLLVTSVFTAHGTTFSKRVFDYALINSAAGGW
jgi:hypothetical protein